MEKCLICNHETYVLEDKQFNIIYFRCRNCGFIHEDERFVVSHDKEKAVYELHNNSIEDKGYVNMFNLFIDVFIDFTIGKEMLDFGSGPEPVFAEIMKRKNFNVTIYDPFYFNDKSYLEKKYDLITSTEVFEHFLNPLDEIRRISSLLKDGGLLAIMTNFPKDDEHFLDWWYRRDETHIAFYTKKSFEVIGQICGLEILYTNNKNYMIMKKSNT